MEVHDQRNRRVRVGIQLEQIVFVEEHNQLPSTILKCHLICEGLIFFIEMTRQVLLQYLKRKAEAGSILLRKADQGQHVVWIFAVVPQSVHCNGNGRVILYTCQSDVCAGCVGIICRSILFRYSCRLSRNQSTVYQARPYFAFQRDKLRGSCSKRNGRKRTGEQNKTENYANYSFYNRFHC